MTRRNISDREHAEALIHAAENLLGQTDCQSEDFKAALIRLTLAAARAKTDLYPAKP